MQVVQCPNCARRFGVPADYAGGFRACPTCRRKFYIPNGEEESKSLTQWLTYGGVIGLIAFAVAIAASLTQSSGPEPIAQAAGFRPTDRPSMEPSWKLQTRQQLQAARRESIPLREPLQRPEEMSETEFQQAKRTVTRWQTQVDLANPERQEHQRIVTDHSIRTQFMQLLPMTFAALEREFLQSFLQGTNRTDIEQTASRRAELRSLGDPSFRQRLQERLPWQTRKQLFDKFAQITGLDEPWSLIHPFDELSGEDMNKVTAYALKVKQGQLANLNDDQRKLLINLRAYDFMEQALEN